MNCHREPTLDGILSDPIVRAVMEADCVNPLELEEMLRQVAQRLRNPSGQHQGGLTRQFWVPGHASIEINRPLAAVASPRRSSARVPGHVA
jgi:hypothetical protein